VKTIDKVTFLLGVMFIVVTQFVATVLPQYFRFYYVIAALYLIGLRVHLYGKDNMQYFLLDYCYMTNALCIVNALFFPNNAAFWQVNFAAANGPLMWAIVAWRNSLVFHSVDKLTSMYIHMVPSIMTFVQRWINKSMCAGGNCSVSLKTSFLIPMALYFLWQIMYLVMTEVVLKGKFEEDPTLMTSLRWIAKDKKNSIHQLMLQAGRKLKILKKDEVLDMKTRPGFIIITFVIFQFAFTIATIIPTMIMYHSVILHGLFFIGVFMVAVWNGAGFYFEVFAKRYEDGLQKTTTPSPKKVRKSSNPSFGEKRSSVTKNKGFCSVPNESERESLAAEPEPEL